jgi:DNA repair protein RecO (recombination protein O)
MLVKTKAIVFSALKYQEKSLIVKCYTQSDGLKSYFVPNAFSGKKSASKMAYFQPLTLLEIEANHKNKGTLEHFKEIRLAVPYQSIPSHIVKSTIVIFLSEILHHSIREEEKNSQLFALLESALLWLDAHDDIANFHLILLLEVTKYLGFYPEQDNTTDPFFEMIEGIFVPFQGVSCLNAHETVLWRKLMEQKIENPGKVFTSTERAILLKILLDFYAIHLDAFKKPKSLEVLREVFA